MGGEPHPLRSLRLFPGYRSQKRSHLLGYDDSQSLRVWMGESYLLCPEQSYDEWVEWVLLYKTDVWVDNILTWRYFQEAMLDPRARVIGSRSKMRGSPQEAGITWRSGNRWASMFSQAAWDDTGGPDPLVDLRATISHLDVGTHVRPSGLGLSSIKAHLTRQYATPSPSHTAVFKDHVVGGRVDWAQPTYYDQAWEIDRRMAYVAEATRPLPVGTTEVLLDTSLVFANQYPTWFGRCWVYLPTPLRLGVFPKVVWGVRNHYPTQPGTYTAWLWKEEAADVSAVGGLVVPERVWAWDAMEPALAPWARWIYAKRMSAPSDQIANLVKKVAVAAIGAMLMQGDPLRVGFTKEETRDQDVILGPRGVPTIYCVERDKRPPSPQMPHWASYILMHARRSLYARMLAEMDTGNVVGSSNYDSMILEQPSTCPLGNGLGEWRQYALHKVQLAAPRWIESEEKNRTPGKERYAVP